MVDAAELTFADSMAIQTLVVAALTLKDRGDRMILLRPQPPVARILALIGADQVITVDGEAKITSEAGAARNLPVS
jgi:anti-anti-sigma factor